MRCSNCDARIPHGATSCPSCGVYALDEPPQPPAPPRHTWWPLALLLALVAGGAAFWLLRAKPAAPAAATPDPVHVVRGRPGGNVAEAEAIRELRHYLTARNNPSECMAVMSHGLRAGSYELTVYDRCRKVSLGNWTVGAKTHEVKMK
jgi:hypothetical protein